MQWISGQHTISRQYVGCLAIARSYNYLEELSAWNYALKNKIHTSDKEMMQSCYTKPGKLFLEFSSSFFQEFTDDTQLLSNVFTHKTTEENDSSKCHIKSNYE